MRSIHQLITETVPVFFFTYNPKIQKIEYVSPQFYDFIDHGEEIDGWSPHEKLKAVIHDNEKQKFDQFFHDLARKNKYESSVELRTHPNKCNIEWFELNTFYPPKKLKELTIVGHIVDITEKKRQYEILRRENQSIENVMNMMAHDLKAPLANISLIVSLIEEMMPKEDLEKFEKYLKTLKDTSKDSGKLINKLLDLATLKGETSKMDLDLHDLCYTIDAVVQKLKVQLDEKNISVTYHFPDYSVEALLDAELFKQVIENLLGNAIKFTPEDGKISIRLKYEDDGIKLSIRDTGIGIPEEHLENLFEGISPIKRSGLKGEPSTGLGLYICKQIVTIHKGNIFAEINKDGGTTMTITLPVPGASAAYF